MINLLICLRVFNILFPINQVFPLKLNALMEMDFLKKTLLTNQKSKYFIKILVRNNKANKENKCFKKMKKF